MGSYKANERLRSLMKPDETIKDFAERVDVTYQQVHRWVKDKSRISEDSCKMLSEKLGVHYIWLMHGIQPETEDWKIIRTEDKLVDRAMAELRRVSLDQEDLDVLHEIIASYLKHETTRQHLKKYYRFLVHEEK